MTFDPEYRMVTLFFSLIFIKKSKIGILEPNILAGTRDPLSISTPYWGPTWALGQTEKSHSNRAAVRLKPSVKGQKRLKLLDEKG